MEIKVTQIFHHQISIIAQFSHLNEYKPNQNIIFLVHNIKIKTL
jgi:hypothetical protein